MDLYGKKHKKIKGSLLKYVVMIIRANKTGSYDEILKEEEKNFVKQRIQDAVWYPFEFYKNLYNAIGKVEAKGEMETAIKWSYDQGKVVIKSMYKNIDEKRSLRHALTSFLHLIKLWFNFGTHDGEIVSDNEINISIGDFDEDFELFYYSTIGWLKAFFEGYSNTNISAKFMKKAWIGDEKTLYNLTWST